MSELAKTKRKTHRRKKSHPSTHIPAHVLNSSSNKKGDDFYTWVNGTWISNARIPPSENDYGIGEEVEDVIFKQSVECINHAGKGSPFHFLQTLGDSCKNDGQGSTDLLHSLVQSVQCVRDVGEVIDHFALLSACRMKSLFSFGYTIRSGKLALTMNPTFPSLDLPMYHSTEIQGCYATMLKRLGDLFHLDLHACIPMEKTLATRYDAYANDESLSIRGMDLCKKFPKIPWERVFAHLPGVGGGDKWKHTTLFYTSPKWIRHLGRLLEDIPLDSWKLFLQKCYIVSSIRFLPAPYSDLYFDFFGRCIQGQKIKESAVQKLVSVVHEYCPDSFSELFWKHYGRESVVRDVTELCSQLKSSAITRLKATDWLEKSTRIAAIEKVRAMKVSAVRPAEWAPQTPIHMNPANLLENIITLGTVATTKMISRLGHRYRFWEEGIYQVNAYYYNENNEIMIPYGTTYAPFYIEGKGIQASSWSYGALGSIIGHEMCHGFDVDGKEYDWKGEKRKWWTRRDNLAYNRKTKSLIHLYNSAKFVGKHIDGVLTLSENIADLGGVGISLEGLKEELARKGIVQYSEILDAYREFFIGYATSWRTIYRDKKLASSIGIDSHAPASIRVNFIVSQFDEWYEAFEIDSDSELYRKPEDRIRIF